jgi:formate dehydrogenase subunit delta
MDIENLVKMANQIGAFFESMPDREQAKADIANHIQKFWEPRMKKTFLEKIDSGEAKELIPMVREAIDAHRGLLV